MFRKFGNRAAHQGLCFCYIYTYSKNPLLPERPKCQASSHLLCGFIAQFVSDLVGKPDYRLSHGDQIIFGKTFFLDQLKIIYSYKRKEYL